MLRHTSVELGIAEGMRLSQLGVKLIPQENTPLSLLVSTSRPIRFVVDSEQLVYNIRSEDPDHNVMMDACINNLKELLVSHLNITRNIVRPIVAEATTSAIEYTKQFFDVSASVDAFQVKTIDLDPIYEDLNFSELIASYATTPPNKIDRGLLPKIRFNLRERSDDEVRALLSTGIASTDETLALTVEKKKDLLSQLYHVFFAGRHDYNVMPYSLEQLIEEPYLYTDELALLFTMAHRLEADVDSSSDMSLGTYKSLINEYKQLFASLLSASVQHYQKFANNGILVLSRDLNRNSITVLGSTYKQFLELGGDITLLYALVVLSSSEHVTVKAILSNADELTKSLNRYIQLKRQTDLLKFTHAVKAQLIADLTVSLNALTELEGEYSRAQPVYLQKVLDLAKAYLERFNKIEPEDIPTIVLNLYTKCRFYFTGSYEILSDLQQLCEQNPETDLRQQALFASVSYLVKHFVSQLAIPR